tara:strand:- start:2441 stop:3490 length:1050 start_codon:yes stop_codon:yes gene_type:complete
MNIKYKYIIGTHVMFYEIEILHEYIDSLIQSVEQVTNRENITFDFVFNLSEYLELLDTSKISKKTLKNRFIKEIKRLQNTGANVNIKYHEDNDVLYAIADYRRDFNYHNCKDNDYLIWGETDSLFPKQFFEGLETIKNYTVEQNIHRYAVWFAERKMWDDSWKPLEHVKFTNETHISPKHYNTEEEYKAKVARSPYSIRYVMGLDEMNTINDEYDSFEIQTINHPKFSGCGLVMSSDLIKAGVNIPPGIFGCVAEDTAMMISAHQIMGSAYRQFILKNVLLIHNREHPKKRMYCLDKTTLDESGIGSSYAHGKGTWYDRITELCKINTHEYLGPKQDRFYTIRDFENES